MTYEYITSPEDQYDWAEVGDKTRIDPIYAQYIKSQAGIDNGNPYIEALPLPLADASVPAAYTHSPGSIAVKPDDSKATILNKVSLLRQIRFPFPFHKELEPEFYMALVNSYRSRMTRRDPDQNLSYRSGGTEEITHQILEAETGAGTNPGFHMLGFSGCGKSSALQVLLSRYPQYLRHLNPDGSYFPQITYVVVSCAANSNFKAVYEGIGRAIDKALGILDSSFSYEYQVKKANSLAAKEALIARYIELFGIGCIILDEIQLIDFESTKENSFEGLMTLANKTKVAIAAVGTEDAYQKMFTKQRTSRRLGNEIVASSYCENKKYFALLCKKLFETRLFGTEVELTTEIVDELYRCSAGIIDQLISLFSFMVIDYYNAKNYPEVNAEYVRKKAEKHFPGIVKILTDMKNPLNDKKRMELVRQSTLALEEMQKEEERKKYEQSLVGGGLDDAMDRSNLISQVCEAIAYMTDDYNRLTIEKETESVLNTKAGKAMNVKELSRKVLSRLKGKKSDKRPPARKAPKDMDDRHLQMLNLLEEDYPAEF